MVCSTCEVQLPLTIIIHSWPNLVRLSAAEWFVGVLVPSRYSVFQVGCHEQE